jgi:alpha-beta hydrolase superfamily lysophospholipase
MRERQSIKAGDGTNLELTLWRPEGEVRFVVIITHGLAEHALRYEEIAEELCAEGALCFGIDLRGQGKSGGPRGHVASRGSCLVTAWEPSSVSCTCSITRTRFPSAVPS